MKVTTRKDVEREPTVTITREAFGLMRVMISRYVGQGTWRTQAQVEAAIAAMTPEQCGIAIDDLAAPVDRGAGQADALGIAREEVAAVEHQLSRGIDIRHTQSYRLAVAYLALVAQPAGAQAGQTEHDAYMELIYAVARKFPGETRHETALRYILNAENSSNKGCEAAANVSPPDSPRGGK